MARHGGASSGSLTSPSAGLASILRDQKVGAFASNGRGNVLIGAVEGSGMQPVSIASSPESPLHEEDVVGEDPDEFKEEDVWAADTRSSQQDLLKINDANGHYDAEDTSYDSGLGKQNWTATAKHLSLGLQYGHTDIETTDNVGIGLKAKKWENGVSGEFGLGFGKQRVSAAEVARSSSSYRGDYFVNGGHSSLSKPSESSLLSHNKTSCRPTASWMIPQLGGVGKHSSRRHAERQSAPVQVPDWSKLMEKHRGKTMVTADDDGHGDEDEDDDRLPPHELLAREYARSHRTTFSVCEGQGRTLKGRDLSRVRDAIWSQMGFAD